jgi:hypothetical protein
MGIVLSVFHGIGIYKENFGKILKKNSKFDTVLYCTFLRKILLSLLKGLINHANAKI